MRARIVEGVVTNALVALLVTAVIAIAVAIPFHRSINYIASRLGAAPVGTILAWNGQGELPVGWKICDGSPGTPNLENLFLRGVKSPSDAGNVGGEDIRTSVQKLAGGNVPVVCFGPKYNGTAINQPKNYSVVYIIRLY
jgi:hypothetical protein